MERVKSAAVIQKRDDDGPQPHTVFELSIKFVCATFSVFNLKSQYPFTLKVMVKFKVTQLFQYFMQNRCALSLPTSLWSLPALTPLFSKVAPLNVLIIIHYFELCFYLILGHHNLIIHLQILYLGVGPVFYFENILVGNRISIICPIPKRYL